MNDSFILDVIEMRRNQKAYEVKGTTRHYTKAQEYQKKVDKHIEKYLSQQTFPF